ncbi:Gfo/Idh/MocA family protein [Leptospira borgpetersenii]|uniref:Gfo/Idh/MocA family protein n=1 Tax=Leptospira borgpetersenii TaxID=174 RepID=UPI00187F9CF3|nr:Gfo/Idh/MocA family oxidoreductase [Leptospira borgpetersenii]MBE8363216.1 Gfo/Idh/MocA family oxidoreductase [Leptospira borgpetersenii serovar Balcanica]MBE8368158.1 Gfo/Idh/MocA family oxidoreductase [Leptospira borgpetersenii serovar Balcanica]MBE8422226.1 Gfo/Idh/MocA family oxidoreductase [Leptospira borgpetersenii serovar Balcanica]MBF3349379.1 Gfo/Idh/MocA family oxidoreductase [Leptospira borgpetersenii serovar Balcanica]MBF3376612.1 Gfo/Idh/MocA family oxidoreductase [Leptospira b
MKKLKVGIAGYGVVGKRRHQYIKQNPNLMVTAICDKSLQDERNAFDNLNIYQKFQDLIQKEELDILLVCLTNDVAAEATILGLKNGLHVFCEKPPGRNVQEISEVREVERQFPTLKLKYGFNHRYHDSIREALKIVSSGKMGKVVNIRGIYGKSAIVNVADGWRANREIAGGGILLDQGIHMVDLIRLFAGEMNEIKSYVSNSYWNLDVEDNAFALMKSESGVIVQFQSTATEWRHRFNLQINMGEGSLVLSGILSGSKSYGQETLTIYPKDLESGGNPRMETINYLEDNSWRDEINEFTDHILKDEPIRTGSSLDAYQTMKLVYQIYHADPVWRERYQIEF